jgi:UPF0755 protein
MASMRKFHKMWIKSKKILTFLALLAFLLTLSLVAIGMACWFHHPQHNKGTVVLIKKGATLAQISMLLTQHQVLDFPFLFKGILYATGDWRHLKAGEYLIPPVVTPAQLIHILKSGDVMLHRVTLIEGETSHCLVQKLIQDPRFQGTCEVPPEGSLLPETYTFPRGTERQKIVRRMQKAMQAALTDIWAQRPQDHPLKSQEEVVILASIVEKETALLSERPLVAAVFLNRLKQAMLLQADPTLLYALTSGTRSLGRELTREDLQVVNPYNTYLQAGLPPTPIANPSLASLKAVMHPAPVSYLYFVANGSGRHVFATTLEEHQKNHAAWRKVRMLK